MDAKIIDKIAAWAVKSEATQNLGFVDGDLFEILEAINPSILELCNQSDEKLGLDSALADAHFIVTHISYMVGFVNGVAVGAGYSKPQQVRPIIEMIVRFLKEDRPHLFETVKGIKDEQEPASSVPN